MILITGDTHGDVDRFKNKKLKKLKKGDALIICGDFGFIWDGSKKEKRTLKKLGKKKYSVLFVEGVHENFKRLNEYETEYWCGGLTRKISGNLRQLMRGEVFEIAGKRIFAFGGGCSEENDTYLNPTDNEAALLRWKEEIPSDELLAKGITNLEDNGNSVDFIVSYEPPAQITEFLTIGRTDRNHINTYLERIKNNTKFDMWFFGRHHINKLIPPKYRAVFNDVVVAAESEYTRIKSKED